MDDFESSAMTTKLLKIFTVLFSINMSLQRVASFIRGPKSTTFRCQRYQYRYFASVTGRVYTAEDPDAPVVRLFTKEGCTLCDKVKDTLASVRESQPHSLEQIDITDEIHKEWFDKYKWDIPVLHGTYC